MPVFFIFLGGRRYWPVLGEIRAVKHEKGEYIPNIKYNTKEKNFMFYSHSIILVTH
jgi:hypothetical protein